MDIPWIAMPGVAFLHPLPGNPHLQVVILVLQDDCLIAPLCSVKGYHQNIECSLSCGDHPFINHDSFIDFSFTQRVSTAEVQSWVSCGSAEHKDPFDMEVLKHIIESASTSSTIPRKFRDLF